MRIELDLGAQQVGIDLGYQRLSDSEGVFTANVTPPIGWESRRFGPFGFQIPPIQVSVFSSGSFVLNVGFPFNGDWSRSARLQMPFFTGQGGFYFGNSPAAALAPFGDQQVTAVLGMGIAARMVIGGSIDFGILSGGVYVEYQGIVQGFIGYGSGIRPGAPPTSLFDAPAALVLDGIFTLSGSLYGSVNFGIVSASVHVGISAALQIAVRNGLPTDFRFAIRVSVSVTVTINCFLFKIHISFSFNATITYGPLIAWPSSAPQLQARRAVVRPHRWLPLSLERLAAHGLVASAPLPLWFAPEPTVVYGASGPGVASLVANLSIPYTPGDAGSTFNQLVQAYVVWATQNDGGPPPVPGVISLDELNDLWAQLTAKTRMARATHAVEGGDDPLSILDYAKLVEFLSTAFTVTITVAPTPASGQDPAQAVFFPMPPDLQLWATGRNGVTTPTEVVDFSTATPLGHDYLDAVTQEFATMQVNPGGDGGLIVDPTIAVPATTYIFEDYFALIIKGAVKLLIDRLTAAGQSQITSAQLAQIDFQDVAGNLATAFRGGLQVPSGIEGGQLQPPVPLYTLSEQLFAALAPATGSYSLSLKPGAAGTWFTLGDTTAALNLAELQAFAKLSVTAPFAEGIAQAAPLKPQAARYSFTTFQPLTPSGSTPSTLMQLPPALTGAALAAGPPGYAVSVDQMPASGSPDAATPVTATIQWATALTVMVQRLPQPGSASGFAANVFQIVATDPRQFAQIDSLVAWIGQGNGVTPMLLYVDPASGGYVTPPAAPADLALLRTNTSTESRPPTSKFRTAALAAAPALPYAASFAPGDAASLLAIIREYGIVNTTGYYLHVPPSTAAPNGLPDALFASAETATLTVLVARTPAAQPASTVVLPSDDTLWFQATRDSTQQYFASALTDRVYQPTQSAGVLALALARANPGTGSLRRRSSRFTICSPPVSSPRPISTAACSPRRSARSAPPTATPRSPPGTTISRCRCTGSRRSIRRRRGTTATAAPTRGSARRCRLPIRRATASAISMFRPILMARSSCYIPTRWWRSPRGAMRRSAGAWARRRAPST